MIKKIAFTLYPVKDIARARKFYEDDLGLKATETFGEGWIEYDLAGGCFAITNALGDQVSPSANSGGSIAFEVDNLDELTSKLKTKGIEIKMGPMEFPVCRMTVVIDPEGNAVTLHQAKDL